MATSLKNLSEYDSNAIPNGADFRIGIVVSEWNKHITFSLLKGAIETLVLHNVPENQIVTEIVPGAFELPLAAQWMAESKKFDAIITIGTVIQGETKHFDYVCSGTTQGIKDVALKFSIPVVFCLLTDNTEQQSIDRSGGKHGNKGVEAALTALKMVELKRKL